MLDIETVYQHDDYSCGAASLKMLFKYHQCPVPRDLHALCCPHDGLQPDAIKAVLQREFGHYTSARMTLGILKGYLADGKPVLCPIIPDEQDGSEPSGHWVIVRGITAKRVHYVCPFDGPESVNLETWARIWRDEPPGSLYQQWGITSWPIL